MGDLLQPDPNNEYLKKEQYTDDKLTDIVEYIENQEFLRVIARYQILISVLLAMFAFFLGAGDYYIAGTFVVLAIITFWIYEKEWDKIKEKHRKMVYEQNKRRTNRSYKNEQRIKRNDSLK